MKPIDEDAEPMPDYSDEEIDKASDEPSETEEVMIDGKLVPKSVLENEMVKYKPYSIFELSKFY